MLVRKRSDGKEINVRPISDDGRIVFKCEDGKLYQWDDLEAVQTTSQVQSESQSVLPFKVAVKSRGNILTFPGKPRIKIFNAYIEHGTLFGIIYEHHTLEFFDYQMVDGKRIRSSEVLARSGDSVETRNTVYLVQNWSKHPEA